MGEIAREAIFHAANMKIFYKTILNRYFTMVVTGRKCEWREKSEPLFLMKHCE